MKVILALINEVSAAWFEEKWLHQLPSSLLMLSDTSERRRGHNSDSDLYQRQQIPCDITNRRDHSRNPNTGAGGGRACLGGALCYRQGFCGEVRERRTFQWGVYRDLGWK